MNNTLSSLTIRCARCGAALPVHQGSPSVGCSYCGTQSQLDAHQMERLKQHMAAIHAADVEARQYREAAGIVQTSRKRICLYFAVFLVPGLAAGLGCLAFANITGERYVVDVLGTRLEASQVVISAVMLVSTAAGLLWMGLDMQAAKHRAAGLSQQVVGVSGCASCGATLPVILGRHSMCPFCGIGLIPGQDAMHRIDAAAHAQADAAYAEYAHELRRIGSFVPEMRPARATAPVGWPPESHPPDAAHPDALARAMRFKPDDLESRSQPDELRLLGDVLDFDLVDLEENRQGRMSTRQRRQRLLPGAIAILAAGVPLLILAAGDWLVVAARVALFALVPLAMLVVVGFMSEAIHGGAYALDAVVTPLTEREEHSDGAERWVTERYYLQADEWQIAVKLKVLAALSAIRGEGRRFRLYRAAFGGRLLSMEPLPARDQGSPLRMRGP